MSTQTQELSGRGKVAILGVLLMLSGIGGALYFAFGFNTTVSTLSVNNLSGGDVVNIGLQQQQMMGFIASIAAALAGLLIVLLLTLSVTIQTKPPEKDKSSTSDD